ncbi:MAG: hypothetical protein WC856_13705 [Methylococcaceae bacterium]|jgi:hypothetical protein
MAYTQTQLDALEAAIAQGALSVQFGERKITYNSYTEMTRLRDTIRAELGVSTPITSRARFITIPTGKGL